MCRNKQEFRLGPTRSLFRLLIRKTIAAIDDDDLSFDISELQDNDTYAHVPPPSHNRHGVSGGDPSDRRGRFSPPIHGDESDSASLAAMAKPRSLPVVLPAADVRYPDLTAALSKIPGSAQLYAEPDDKKTSDLAKDQRSPLERFRTFPLKPLSVSDLTAGVWCELQHWYTLTKLPGGRRRRTKAMEQGSIVHARLEREIFTEVPIVISTKEDHFGLKMWNMIEGLRMLRDQGMTREFELWGMADGNLVCGIIDSISSENPHKELEEDVLSSRGSSQASPNSQPSSTADGGCQFYITEIKTRVSATPPPAAQEKVAITQLLLYHRFLSDLASGNLNFLHVFQRYGFDPDEPFSDSFMAQTGAIHDEIFASSSDSGTRSESTVSADDAYSSGGEFVSAPSSPSQLSFEPRSRPTLKYHNLRSLVSLVHSELQLTFPRGAADISSIVAVEYRYRQRDPPEPNHDGQMAETLPDAGSDLPEPGDIILKRAIFVDPSLVDKFIEETMSWWRGQRPPRGVDAQDAGLKCGRCDFAAEYR
ncbi:hypothetical protein VTJ49DRAFT_7168 [Mycothermus thermophilus]|uniref:Exonuclease V n=1 Tax=Humicola insolens TaxID=85995 RepID=A0ABR3VIN1_HUMIN